MDIKKRIHHDDDFQIARADFLYGEEQQQFREWLSNKKYSLKDIKDEATYRTINHWDSLGLLEDERKTKEGWRKFNVIDLVWIQIISELRRFGLSLDKIKVAKQSIFYLEYKPENKSYFLDLFISCCFNKYIVYILIFENGHAEFATEEEYEWSLTSLPLDSHILISLSKILIKLFPKGKFGKLHSFKENLSFEEAKILNLIRNNKYETVSIRFKDGKVNLFEGKESISDKERIINILKENKYQDIEIKQADGKIVSIKRTEKVKI